MTIQTESLIDCIIMRHQADASDEHIIPGALGGRLITRRVCTKCNNDFCSKLDAILADNPLMRFARFTYKAPGYEAAAKRLIGEGTLPDGTPAIVNFDDDAGIFKARVPGSGKIVRDNGDGTAQIAWNLGDTEPSRERRLQIVNRELKKRGQAEITDSELDSRVTQQVVEIERPETTHNFSTDLVGISLAGLKIAYEFTFDTLGDSYLEDPIAHNIRQLIVSGVPESDAPNRATVVTYGSLNVAEKTEESPWKDLPDSTHAIVLASEAGQVAVALRLFNIFEGVFLLSQTAGRYMTSEKRRSYTIDVVTHAVSDIRI